MWINPIVALFLPQTNRVQLGSVVTSFKRGSQEIENQTAYEDDSAIDIAWDNILMVESDGNYLGEKQLEVGPLYSKQNDLKALPVPKLSETVKRFLPTAVPLAETDDEAESLIEAANAFEMQASKLQERLEERQEACKAKHTSWIQEFWQSDCYLKCREPLNFYISYYFLVNDPSIPQPKSKDSADACFIKAASILQAACAYSSQITLGLKAPDTAGKKKEPLCSSGYKYLFNTCRIPRIGADTCRIYNPLVHQHVIVACRGHFFEMPVTGDDGQILDESEFEARLRQCEEESRVRKAPLELGWLTTWDRDNWAKARKFLLENGGSEVENSLQRLESALFVLNLDVDTTAESLHDQAQNFFHGGEIQGMNRWWDKSMQISVTRNGKWAYIGEHSMADGMLPTGFCDYLLMNTQMGEKDEVELTPRTTKWRARSLFQDIAKSYSNKDLNEMEERIDNAKEDFVTLTKEITMRVAHNRAFGSSLIKKAGVSGDAFAQMAMQLASYRLFGKLVATYESTQVRPFLHGRTETTRTVSPAALSFVRSMEEKPIKSRTVKEKEELLKLLQQAAFVHVRYSKKATMGLGVDRHFFGLSKMLGKGETEPDLFTHPVYQRSKHWTLSTSTLPTCPGFGFVVDDGLGVGYAVYDDSMVFNIAAKTSIDIANDFHDLLLEALKDMQSLIEEP